MAEKNRYFFDHVPKAAGLSVRRAFELALGPGEMAPAIDGELAASAVARLGRFRFLAGHVDHAPGEAFAPDRYYFTVLRHPVDRVISAYYHLRHQVPLNGTMTVRDAHTLDLDRFIDVMVSRAETEVMDWQCVHFAMLVSRDFGPGKANLLALAKQGLAKFDLVIPFEEMQSGLDLLCDETGLPAFGSMPQENVNRARPALHQVSPETVQKIEALNANDLALYEHVRAGFSVRRREARAVHVTTMPAAATPPTAPAPAANPEDFGDRAVEIESVLVAGERSREATELLAGEVATVRVRIRAFETVPDLTVGIAIVDESGEIAFGTNSHLMRSPIAVRSGRHYEISFRAPMQLGSGVYSVTLALHRGSSHLERCFHWRDRAAQIRIGGTADHPFSGYLKLNPDLHWGEVA